MCVGYLHYCASPPRPAVKRRWCGVLRGVPLAEKERSSLGWRRNVRRRIADDDGPVVDPVVEALADLRRRRLMAERWKWRRKRERDEKGGVGAEWR